MQTQIQKWGNSLGIRISKEIANKLQISSGAIVNVSILDNNLIITPKVSELDLLLNEITGTNIHSELFNDNDLDIGCDKLSDITNSFITY